MKKSTNSKATRIATRKMSIESKIAISGLIVVLLVGTILGLTAYQVVSDYLVNDIKTNVKNIAETIALQTDGDAFDTLNIGDEGTEIYKEMQDAMFDFFVAEDVAYAYSLKQLNENEVQFIVAADPAGDPCKIGDPFELQAEMAEALNGNVAVTEEPMKDEWGVFYTAYAPIYNAAREVVGIVGVDCESSQVSKQIEELMIKLVVAGLTCMMIAIIASFIFARRIGKNMYIVNQKLDDVVHSDGDLTKKLEVSSGDELEVIAENVNMLLDNLKEGMIKVRTSSNGIKKSFDTFTEDMNASAQQVTQVSATMQEMHSSLKMTSNSFDKAKEISHLITTAVDGIKDKTARGFEFSKEIAYKSSELEVDVKEAQRQANEKMLQVERVINGKIEQAKRVAQINDLTQNIIEMASQTGLLALNANIEAARAGEHGRGFSIVAQEVAKLAEESSATANEIKEASGIIVQTVDELTQMASGMIKYVQDEIIKDYDMFVVAGSKYSQDAEAITKLMDGCKLETEKLYDAFMSVQQSMGEISNTIDVSMDRTVNVTQIATEIESNMKQMEQATKINQQDIITMNEVVNEYKVD